MMKSKRLLISILSLIVLMLLLPNVVNAGGLKAEKPTNGIKCLTGVSLSNFFTLIKQMQSSTGTLGVASDAKKIDCHMAKATEWGTAAMLGISKYGNAPKYDSSGNATSSTTGNNTGVFEMAAGREWVAGVYEGRIPTGIDEKYFNVYTSTIDAIPGDALKTSTGYVSGYGNPYAPQGSYPYLSRSNLLLETSYCSKSDGSYGYGSRAVVVCGSEI